MVEVRTEQGRTARPTVSVVLPTHGRRTALLRTLRALGRQSIPADTFEVVVICDGDIDGSAAACRTLAAELPYVLCVLEQENQGPAAARNRGVQVARAALIVFLDDDVVPDERLLAAHLNAQADQEARVAIGPLLPPPDVRLNPWGAWEEATLCRQYDSMMAGRWDATYRQFYTGNASILRRHIVEAGGFDPTFRRAEDVELALRLRDHGLHFLFIPEARGWHYVSRSFESWLRMSTAYGAAEVAMARRWPHVLELVAQEYPYRNKVVRLANPLCMGRPRAMRAMTAFMGWVVRQAAALRLAPLSNLACSLIFNLRYYDALAAALGGRGAFHHLLRGEHPASLMQNLSDQQSVDAG